MAIQTVRRPAWQFVQRTIYWVVFPVLTAAALLILSGRQSRPLFFESEAWDIGARIYITLVYWYAFVYFSNATSLLRAARGLLRLGPNEHPVFRSPIWWGPQIVLLLAIVVSITAWTVTTFLPSLQRFALLLGAIYGLAMAVPEVLRRIDRLNPM